MATTLDDLDQFFAPGLTLTVLGREYTVPLASAELGLWCRRMAEAAGEISEASTPAEVEAVTARLGDLPDPPGGGSLPERLLGDAYTAMVANDVPDVYIQYCMQTAWVWIVGGDEAAEAYWTSGGRPESPRPANRAQRRAASGKGTGGAAGTRSRASTSGTTSRPRRPANSKRATGQRGATS